MPGRPIMRERKIATAQSHDNRDRLGELDLIGLVAVMPVHDRPDHPRQ